LPAEEEEAGVQFVTVTNDDGEEEEQLVTAGYYYVKDIYEFDAHTCIIDIIREVGINNPKAAVAATGALARMCGVEEVLDEYTTSLCYMRFAGSDSYRNSSVYYRLSDISGSKVEVQLLKILKKFSDNENIVINVSRCLAGLVRNASNDVESGREKLQESLCKLSMYPILTDTLKSLGLIPMNFVKDEVVVLYIGSLLRELRNIKESDGSEILGAIYLLVSRFCETSSKVTQIIFYLVESLARDSISLVKKVADMGFIELLCKYYLVHRYQVYLSIDGSFCSLCSDVLEKSKDENESTKSKFLEVYELTKPKFIEAGIVQICGDMWNKKNIVELCSLGMDEGERSELTEALKCTGLLDEISYFDDEGNAIYTEITEGDDESEGYKRYFYTDKNGENVYLYDGNKIYVGYDESEERERCYYTDQNDEIVYVDIRRKL